MFLLLNHSEKSKNSTKTTTNIGKIPFYYKYFFLSHNCSINDDVIEANPNQDSVVLFLISFDNMRDKCL